MNKLLKCDILKLKMRFRFRYLNDTEHETIYQNLNIKTVKSSKSKISIFRTITEKIEGRGWKMSLVRYNSFNDQRPEHNLNYRKLWACYLNIEVNSSN